jgi:hypothetical protein
VTEPPPEPQTAGVPETVWLIRPPGIAWARGWFVVSSKRRADDYRETGHVVAGPYKLESQNQKGE